MFVQPFMYFVIGKKKKKPPFTTMGNIINYPVGAGGERHDQ